MLHFWCVIRQADRNDVIDACGGGKLQVPSLIHSIRSMGLLVGVYGKADDQTELISASHIDATPVDAYINGSTVVFVDNATRDLI